MKKIGIICASDVELAPFLPAINNLKIIEKAMLKFYVGTICRINVVAVYSGVCKVNAAVATQLLIEKFHTDSIINAGTAGGLADNVQLFDTVISEQTAYHDMTEDILTEFHPWLSSIYFQADSALLSAAKNYCKSSQYPIHFGKIVTGEQFIMDSERQKIIQKFKPLAVDMETASVAHVCYVNSVPFLAIRTVTDTADHSGLANFEKNCETASKISADIVMDLLATFAT